MTTVNERRWDIAQEGAELLREGSIADAVTELERVVAEDDQNEYAFFFLGSAHFEAGRFEKALKCYLRALELAPLYTGALVNAGHTLRMMGRHDEALRVARQLLERDKNDADAIHLAGLAHFARGERAMAEKLLGRFLETQPELEVANEVQGLLQILRGEIEADAELDEPRPPRSTLN